MKKDGYYSSGQFARMAGVTLRTIRYYDQHDILKPSLVTEAGARFYTDGDFARLRADPASEIPWLFPGGYPGNDHRRPGQPFYAECLKYPAETGPGPDRADAAGGKSHYRTRHRPFPRNTPWTGASMLDLIHLTVMEKSLKNQYQNAIQYFCQDQSAQPLFRKSGRLVSLDLTAAARIQPGYAHSGTWLWGRHTLDSESGKASSKDVTSLLSDISEGMLRDARRAIGGDPRFSFKAFDCHNIPSRLGSFDLVIANHVLFYCEDIGQKCARTYSKILNPGGRFLCSTYGLRPHAGSQHCWSSPLTSALSFPRTACTKRFGRENGADILSPYFRKNHLAVL